jgi:heat shock protein HslJ
MRLLLISGLAGLLWITLAPGIAQAQDPAQVQPDGLAPIPPIVWQLSAFPGAGAINDAGRYTVQFLPDGTVSIKADCNWLGGFWSGGNGALDITITTSTRVACPTDSLEQPYMQALQEATAYTVDGVSLVITGSAGEMQFSPAMPAVA